MNISITQSCQNVILHIGYTARNTFLLLITFNNNSVMLSVSVTLRTISNTIQRAAWNKTRGIVFESTVGAVVGSSVGSVVNFVVSTNVSSRVSFKV